MSDETKCAMCDDTGFYLSPGHKGSHRLPCAKGCKPPLAPSEAALDAEMQALPHIGAAGLAATDAAIDALAPSEAGGRDEDEPIPCAMGDDPEAEAQGPELDAWYEDFKREREEEADPLIAKLREVTSGPKGNRPDYIAMLSTADATEILRRLRLASRPSGEDGERLEFTLPPSGNCPVQAEGTIDGEPFYFRARGETVSIEIGQGNTALVVAAMHHANPQQDDEHMAAMDAARAEVEARPVWCYEESNHEWPAAGWISEEFARAWIALAAVRYRESRAARAAEGPA